MDLERAREITAQCLRNRMHFIIGGEYVPLPDCSLEEMLQANRLVQEADKKASEEAKPDEDGVTRYATSMTVDPRGIAASYAWEQYWRNPTEYLAAVGLRLRGPDDDDDDSDDGEEQVRR